MENAEETTSLKVRISTAAAVVPDGAGVSRVLNESVSAGYADVGSTSSPRAAYVITLHAISVL